MSKLQRSDRTAAVKHGSIQRALLAGVVVSLLAEISINPFGTAFRFSLGPAGLAFFALFFMGSVYLSGAAAGLIVPIVHGLFALMRAPHAGVMAAMGSYLPETAAYSVLGLLLHLFRVRDQTRSPLRLMLLLGAADVLANVTELIIRREPILISGAIMMALVALGRALVSEGAFYVLQEGVRERQWAEERRSYVARLILVANLQTEAFFLKKSTSEIEQIMAKAHRLYRDLAGLPGQPLALEIAKDIHEVKKDHQRTLAALFRLVGAPELRPEMHFAEVAEMVVDVNRTYALSLGKQISFSVGLQADFRTPRFGRWVTILNNLVSNGVEACKETGAISIASERAGGQFVLRVTDTGPGIPAEDWELVFSPGFTTKVNPVTGNFSSGIGLTHVAGLIEGMHGSIQIERSGPEGTVIRAEVPWAELEAVTQQEEE